MRHEDIHAWVRTRREIVERLRDVIKSAVTYNGRRRKAALGGRTPFEAGLTSAPFFSGDLDVSEFTYDESDDTFHVPEYGVPAAGIDIPMAVVLGDTTPSAWVDQRWEAFYEQQRCNKIAKVEYDLKQLARLREKYPDA